MRICSLLPSATEIVASLRLVESLVAVSEECDWPPEVRALPVVTASRVDTTRLLSLEIDKAVREALGDGRPLYAIDRELLEALEPELILTQNLCTVCAVSGDSVEELYATDAEVVALDAHTLAEIEERILLLANLLGVLRVLPFRKRFGFSLTSYEPDGATSLIPRARAASRSSVARRPLTLWKPTPYV